MSKLVFSHLSETINGISTIKACNRTEEFSKTLRSKMDVSKRCEWLMLSGTRWLKFFLNALTNIIILIVTSQVPYFQSKYLIQKNLIYLFLKN